MITMLSHTAARVLAGARRATAALSVLFVAVVLLAGIAVPDVAQAQVQSRTIGGTFGFGPGAFGGFTNRSYSYDPSTGAVSSVSISVGFNSGHGFTGSTMVSGFRLNATDLVLCSTDPCVANSSMALRLSGGVQTTNSGMTYGVCGSVGAAQSGGAGTGCTSIATPTAFGNYSQSFPAMPLPTVTGLSPSTGVSTGGTTVTLTGSNFTGATAVTFGEAAVSVFTVNSDTSITATSPSGTAGGTVDVTVTTFVGTGLTSGAGNNFSYVQPVPVVTGLTPSTGPAGTSVTLAGTNLENTSAIFFGSVQATSWGWSGSGSSRIYRADAPAGQTGTVDVTVVTPGGASSPDGAGNDFTYAAPQQAIVSSVTFAPDPLAVGATGTLTMTFANPNASASPAISTTLTYDSSRLTRVIGSPGGTCTGFSNNIPTTSSVRVSGLSVPAGSCTITFQFTGAAQGQASLGLTAFTPTGYLQTTAASNTVTVSAGSPTVTAVSPANGAAGGGASVTLTGVSFTGATAVTFGATPATSFTVVSDTSITATAPAGSGVVDVTVTTPVGASANAGTADDFTYVAAPTEPTISSPAADEFINTTTPTVTGQATPGATITVILDTVTAGTTVADATTGAWTFPIGPLSEGIHRVRAVANNVGGTSPPSVRRDFTVDTAAPAAPVITSPAPGVLMQAVTLVSGTAEPMSRVDVYIDDGSSTPTIQAAPAGPQGGNQGRLLGSTQADASGQWTVTARTSPQGGAQAAPGRTGPQSLGERPTTLYALTTDRAGNSSVVSTIVTLTTDPVAPVTPTPTGPTSGTAVYSARPIFSGTGGEPNSTVIVLVDETEYGRSRVAPDGVWTVGDGNGGKPEDSLSAPTGGLSAGTHSWYVVAVDAVGNQSAPSAPITFNVVLVVITQTTVPNGAVASAYDQTLTATGGAAPYSFVISAGALPAGLSLNTSGRLSGTPTAGGVFNFTVRATDSVSQSATQAFSLTIAAPTVTATSTVPAARRGFAYNQTLTGSGGTGPYTFALQSGSLPTGLTLSTAGVLSGTPTVIGSFPVVVRVTDSSTGSGPYSGTVNLTVVVSAAAITVTPTSLPGVMAGLPYDQTMSATGGAGSYSYAVTAGALPNGITLSSAGRLAGNSYAVGTFTFTVTATDSFSNTGSVALSLTILARPDPALDPDVRGINAAQAEATRRLTSTQIDNFSRRLEDLRRGGAVADLSQGIRFQSGIADLGQQADPRNRFGGGRVFDQQAMDPDRAELNAMLWRDAAAGIGSGPIGRGPSGPGLAVVPVAAGDMTGSQSGGGSAPAGGVRLWTGGAITVGERDADSGQAAMSITSTGISIGADFAVSPTFDLGFGGGLGEESADIGSRDSSVDSRSFVGVVYGSWRPEGGIYVDGMLGRGSLSFDMRRRVAIDNSLVTGDRDGTAIFGSLAVGMDRMVGDGQLSTYGRLESLNAELDAYTETGSPFWALSYAERDVESLQGVVGSRYVWSRTGRDSVWTPSVRAEYRQELAEGGLQGLRYADWAGGPLYQIDQSGWERGELNLGLGLNVQTTSGWQGTAEFGGRFSEGQTLGTLRLGLSRKF